MTSSWRRNADEALPARGKIVGGYVNMAFQKTEAELNGFDEAIVLTAGGHVNEASAANVFVVRDGVALTPPVSDDLLEGVTRKAIIELLAQRGDPARGPLDRPLRAVRRRRDVPVRDGRPGLVGRRGRPSAGRFGPDRADRPAGPRPLLRRGARPTAGVRSLADPDRIGSPGARSGLESGEERRLEVRGPLADGHDDVGPDGRVRLDRRLHPERLLEVGDRLRQAVLGAVVDDDRRVRRAPDPAGLWRGAEAGIPW